MKSKINGSDKNVGSIKKDIERCEQLTKTEHANWIGLSNQHAIEHLIKAYKELKEITQTQQAEIEKKDKIIDLMLEEFTDCEFELKCSECCYECEKDYDQLYMCNKEYFERKIK